MKRVKEGYTSIHECLAAVFQGFLAVPRGNVDGEENKRFYNDELQLGRQF
jgi:hypothetical protein